MAASAVTCAALLIGNLPVGSAAGVPSWPATFLSAATCSASSAPNVLSTDRSLPWNSPLLITLA